MEDYTLALALQDALPVILFGAGLYWLARMCAQMYAGSRWLALSGVMLITTGGLTKVVYKLLVAIQGAESLPWLNNILFIFLAPGFTLFVLGIVYAQRNQKGLSNQHVWIPPLILLGLSIMGAAYTAYSMPDSRIWVYILLATTTIANVWASILLIRHSLSVGLKLAAVLFTLNIVLVFVLNGLGRMGDMSAAMQWIEQTVNLFSALAFTWAAWNLSRHVIAQQTVGGRV